jgi:L-fuculose-phosphate aldolase
LSEEEVLKQDIVKVTSLLYDRGLITAIGGNVSARAVGAKEFWITPSGLFKRDLTPDDLVKCDLQANAVEGLMKPSIETPFHATIFRRREDVNAVVHAHNPVATALGIAGVEIEPLTMEAALLLAKVPIVPFKHPGTSALADAVGENIVGHRALILKNHGVIGVGYDLIEAMSAVELLEEVSTIMYVSKIFGKATPIPAEEIEGIKKLYKI